MQYFNDSDADEEFEGFDEFDIVENIEIVCGTDIEQAENDRDMGKVKKNSSRIEKFP